MKLILCFLLSAFCFSARSAEVKVSALPRATNLHTGDLVLLTRTNPAASLAAPVSLFTSAAGTNLNSISVGFLTVSGAVPGLCYFDASTNLNWVGWGTNGQVLVSTGTGAGWQTLTNGGTSGGTTNGGGGTSTNCPADGSPRMSTSGSSEGNVGYDGNHFYAGGIYTPASNHTVCKLRVSVQWVHGSMAGKTLRVAVWSMSGNNLASELAYCDVSGTVTTGTKYAPLSTEVSLTSGVAVAFTMTIGSSDNTNYIGESQGSPGAVPIAYAGWQANGNLGNGPSASVCPAIGIYWP